MSKIETLLPSIQALASQAYDELVQIRRTLHRRPERSGDEAWTALYLAEKCAALGLKVRLARCIHGFWADLIVDPAKPTVALRVDIDALPIDEINTVSYRSMYPGLMHACGHDVHAAIGVGVARVLTQLRSSLPGNVRLIFQPEEEEITGAVRMIRAGALNHPRPGAIIGLHVAPLPAGQIGWTDGLFLAGFAHYLVSLAPRQGQRLSLSSLNRLARRCCHAIQRMNRWHLPETWPEMAAFWTAMQAPPADLLRFIVYDASTSAEDAPAWRGQFGLGVKAANPHLMKAALGKLRAALNPLCRAAQARYRIERMGAMIDMRNNPWLVHASLPALVSALGGHNLVHIKAAFPFNCEDFAYYTKKIPGAMYWLGAANPAEGKYAMLHTPDFDVDESCLETGTIAMASLLYAALFNFTNISKSSQ